MEIVDELMTPGCPNCAIKHLSAALERVVDGINVPESDTSDAMTLMARAYVNFVEAAEGYASHFDYAVGLLQRAEELAVMRGLPEFAKLVREHRVRVMTEGASGKPLFDLYLDSLGRLAAAHFREAVRELPALSERFDTVFPSFDADGVVKIRAMIAWVREEYFGTTAKTPGEKGEDTMATCAKKAACKAGKAGKAAPVAKKAACKGGKCGCKKGRK